MSSNITSAPSNTTGKFWLRSLEPGILPWILPGGRSFPKPEQLLLAVVAQSDCARALVNLEDFDLPGALAFTQSERGFPRRFAGLKREDDFEIDHSEAGQRGNALPCDDRKQWFGP